MELVTASDAEPAQRRLAALLHSKGLRPADRLVIVSPSSADLLVLVLAALRRGIVPVLLNPALLEAEQEELIADADPALVLRGNDVAALSAEALTRVGAPGSESELAPFPLARPMHYTSGTTGRPKGVWSGVLSELDATRMASEERELWGFETTDLHLVCAPLCHSAPVRFAVGTLLAGGAVLLPGKFDAVAAAEAIRAHRPSTTFMAPAHLQRLFALGREVLPPLGSFRLLAHAGSACPEPLKRAALGAFPDGTVWEFYGSTEGQFTACSPAEWLERPGTVGRARPGRRLATDDDAVIWCETPPHARFEYWRDADKTQAAWRDGAFTVGDVGRLDEAGYLFLDGRRNDLIISGGVNVYPAEVERVLHELAGVEEVAVFGLPDERWGQRVCAAIVGPVDEDAVVAFARSRLAPYKCPKQVVRVSEIPLGAMGKVRRSTLAADLGLE